MMTDTQTLREAVARAICEAEGYSYISSEHYDRLADAAIATMFERLRDLPPSIYDGPDQYIRKADVLAAFQQENSDATGRSIATRLHPDNPHGDGAWE